MSVKKLFARIARFFFLGKPRQHYVITPPEPADKLAPEEPPLSHLPRVLRRSSRPAVQTEQIKQQQD